MKYKVLKSNALIGVWTRLFFLFQVQYLGIGLLFLFPPRHSWIKLLGDFLRQVIFPSPLFVVRHDNIQIQFLDELVELES